ncbi:hypothetical protein PG990_009246 [Apiospora arundinis]
MAPPDRQQSLLRRATSRLAKTFFGRQPQGQEKDKEKGHMESVQAYQITWEEIDKILSRYFPKKDFHPKLRGDKWVFYVPTPLQENAREDLRKLKDRRRYERSSSPEDED